MITNGMFFGQEGSPTYKSKWTIDLHFFALTYFMLYTSIVSVAIVLPVNELVVWLFTRLSQPIPKLQENPARCYLTQKVMQLLSRVGLQARVEANLTLTTGGLPFDGHYQSATILDIDNYLAPYGDETRGQHCCCTWRPCSRLSGYLGWLLVVLSCVVSAFFLLLYSIEWGKDKSEAWLATFFLSFTESIFVFDPLKVSI